jgi:hypothetical protein
MWIIWLSKLTFIANKSGDSSTSTHLACHFCENRWCSLLSAFCFFLFSFLLFFKKQKFKKTQPQTINKFHHHLHPPTQRFVPTLIYPLFQTDTHGPGFSLFLSLSLSYFCCKNLINHTLLFCCKKTKSKISRFRNPLLISFSTSTTQFQRWHICTQILPLKTSQCIR